MRKGTLFGIGFAFFIMNILESPALAKTSSFERKQEAWSQLNCYSPSEGFHSKGSYGVHVGVGAVASKVSSSPFESAAQDAAKQELTELQQPTPRLFLSTGTPWPLDFGASLSLLEGPDARQGGAHAQWTLFEGFQLPSVALRMSRSLLTNFHEVKEFTTDAFEVGVSYGLIRYITMSLALSEQWERGRTQAKGELLTLSERDLPEWSSRRRVYSWGINISPFTPFIQIGLEQSYWNKQAQVAIAKISFLL